MPPKTTPKVAPKAASKTSKPSVQPAAKPAAKPPAPKFQAAKPAPQKPPLAKPAAPAAAAPKTAAPKAPAPKVAAPKAALPKSNVPQAAAPKAVAPKSAAPKSAAPKSAAPKANVAAAAQAKAAAPPAPPACSPSDALKALANLKSCFHRSTQVLEESDSSFVPVAGVFSTAQQVAHAAQTVDWFLQGAFRPEGFNMDFPGLEAEVRKVTSLAAARRWLDEAFGRLEAQLRSRSAAEWAAPIAKDTIMGGCPRISIVDGLNDHTAHHRGALTVYARLRGKTPAMPYM